MAKEDWTAGYVAGFRNKSPFGRLIRRGEELEDYNKGYAEGQAARQQEDRRGNNYPPPNDYSEE